MQILCSVYLCHMQYPKFYLFQEGLNKKLHDILVSLKQKLTKQFIETMSKQDFDSYLKDGDYEGAKLVSQTMINEYYGCSPIKNFSSKFDTLIGIVSGKTNFSVNQFNAIKANTFTTAPIVQSEDHESLTNEGVSLMECPIMMTEDAIVIPILSGEPILYGEDKKVIDQVMKNPLSILSYDHLVDKIKSRLSQSFGLYSYCEIYKTTRLDPLTREPISGCIPLGSNREYVNEATKAIMHLFTGGRILGNVDLYYAVLYFICNDVEFLSDVFYQIQEQMIYRMNNHKTSASLSGMAELVGTKILFKEAIWFVLTSGSLYTDNTIIPIRQHAFVQDKLIELNSLNGYRISLEDLQYCKLTKMMLSMLQRCKKDPQFQDKIRSLYQSHIRLVEGEKSVYIFFNSLIDMSSYSVDEINEIKMQYIISKLVDPSKSASDIKIGNVNVDLIDFPVFTDIWSDREIYKHYPCIININTCRPIYRLSESTTWEDSYKEVYSYEKILSLNKYFGDYVYEKKEYPNIEQLALYTWKRESGKGETTLPSTIMKSCELIINDYQDIISSITPEVFAERFNLSVNRIERERLEKL